MKKAKTNIWGSGHSFVFMSPPGPGKTPTISEEPPTPDKKDEPADTPNQPEKKEDQPEKRGEMSTDMAAEATKITPEAETLNKLFHEKAKTYAENVDKLPEEEAKKVREKAAEKSMIELQGWEWLGLDEKSADQRHLKLAQAFLTKTVDQNGQEVFLVKPELDHSENTRMGIGAGHLLPPSIKEVEITDNNNVTRRGTRKLINGQKAGYYDESGNYLPIFGGYKIRPLDFIDEKGEDYKKQVEAEIEHYKNLKAIDETYRKSFGHIPGEEAGSTAGIQSEYVSSLSSLEDATEESLKAEKASAKEIERIMTAKKDWFRIKAVCGSKGFRLNAASEAYGATYILGFKGEGAKMLGWSDTETTKQNELTTKLEDKTYIEESLKDLKEVEEKELPEGITIVKSKEEKTGYYFKDKHGLKVSLDIWTARQAAKTVQLSETATFIKAMQSGTTYMGYDFIGNYNLDIAHLKYLHYLVEREEGQKTLKEALEKVKKTNGSIDPMDLIKYIETSSMPDEGLSIDEVIAYCKKNPNLSWMVDPNWRCKCCSKKHANFNALLRKGPKVKPPITAIDYQWNMHKDTAFVGKLQCARTVSDILGLHGRYKSCTSRLAPALIQANLEKTGKTGIVFGMENFKEGDVIMWRGSQRGPKRQKPNGGYENYGHNAFSHTAIVRHVMIIEGEKYLAMQHNSDRLYIELVPVSRRPHNLSKVKQALKTRSYEGLAQTSSDPDKLRRQFADIFGFRPRGLKRAGKGSKALVRVRFHKDDSKMQNGTFAFAIRTAHLQSTPGHPSPIM